MSTASTGFAQDIELYNFTNEDFHVQVHIWLYPPCPGVDPHSDWWVCVPANSMVPIVAPPEKFLKFTKIACECSSTDPSGSSYCEDTANTVFECNSVWYTAGNGDREFRVEYY
ncbi:MAG: hypothetical protein IPM12_16050 [Flavobacteriales bacterium]|nr:hypothetical protein [Flavobacteriales bacterium]